MAIEFEVKLSDGVSAPALSAADKIGVLSKQLQTLQTAMYKANVLGESDSLDKMKAKYSKLNAEFQKLGGPGVVALAAQEKAQSKLAKELDKAAAAQAKAAAVAESKAQKEMAKAAAAQAKAQAKLQKEMQKSAASAGGATSQISALGQSFVQANQPAGMLGNIVKALGPEVMAVAAAAVAAAAAIAAVAAAFVGAIKVAGDFAQQQRALENTFNALGRGTTSGKQMAAMFDELGKVLPASRSQMAEWNKSMMQGGVTDVPRLMQATKAAAAASALMGDESGKAGEKITGLVVEISKAVKLRQGIGDLASKLEGTGISAEEVAKKMGIGVRQLNMMAASGLQLNKIGNTIQDALIRKGAGPMRDMMSTWNTVSSKMKDSAAKLFSGITETKGFKAFSEQLVRLLGTFDSSAGRTKNGVTTSFDVMFKFAARMLQEFRYAMLRTEIKMLTFYLAILPAIKVFRRLEKVLSDLDDKTNAVGLTLSWLGDTFMTLALGPVGPIMDMIELFTNAGPKMIDGLVKGLKNGYKAVKDAVVGLASGATDAFKGALGIKSPSRVFAQFGVQTTAGFAVGVRQAAPAAMAATSDMASKATEGGKVAVESAKAPSGRGGGLTVNVGGITIQGGGGSSVELLEEAVVSLFERVALTQGVA